MRRPPQTQSHGTETSPVSVTPFPPPCCGGSCLSRAMALPGSARPCPETVPKSRARAFPLFPRSRTHVRIPRSRLNFPPLASPSSPASLDSHPPPPEAKPSLASEGGIALFQEKHPPGSRFQGTPEPPRRLGRCCDGRRAGCWAEPRRSLPPR